MLRIYKTLFHLVLSIVVFSSCKKQLPDLEFPVNTNFVSAKFLGTFTRDELQARGIKSGYSAMAALAQYDVDYYRVIYTSTFKGKEIQLSGLMGIPKNMVNPPSILSAQHVDMFRIADAPGNFPTVFTGLELFASAGFIDLMPDYIGLGVSSHITHPYYDKASLGPAVIFMIHAAKYFLNRKQIAFSSKLYLAGYSEGGYVSHAAQKIIESDSSSHLTLTASVQGGFEAYIPELYGHLSSYQTLKSPALFAMLIEGYNKTFDWNRPNTDFYAPQYAQIVPGLLDGTKTKQEIDAALPVSMKTLLNPLFLTGLEGRTPEREFKSVVERNLADYNFFPQSPTWYYHGQADEWFAFGIISGQAWYRWAYLPESGKNNKFFTISGGTHASVEQPMLVDAVKWFQQLDK